jgi:hypothetical protein
VVVITAGELRKHSNPEELARAQEHLRVFSALHAKLAALSTRGRHVTLPEAGHISLIGEKRHADEVVGNILQIVQESRAAGEPR